MARKAMILKQKEEPKFSTRYYNRCKICGRPHAYLRDYGVCRICFRELDYKGQIPGVRKASWQIFSRNAAFLSAWRTQSTPAHSDLALHENPHQSALRRLMERLSEEGLWPITFFVIARAAGAALQR